MREKPITARISTPERTALRTKIADELYNHDIANRKHGRELTMILGLPASGKSTVGGPIVKETGAIEVDSDLAKAMLPEYDNGIGAFATHEESSKIALEVLRRAIENGDNIVYPRVDSPDKVVSDVQRLKDKGYTVHVKYMDNDVESCEKSVITRFLKTGRYVSPLVVREFGDKPKQSFEAIKNSGIADSYEVIKRGPQNSNAAA